MNFQKQSRRRAFTLIEIMLAIAIFSIVVAAIYSTWTLILRASKTGMEAAAQVQRERIAVRTIEDSLTCIQSFQASMSYYYFVVQKGDQSELSFTARVPKIFPRNGRFGDFTLRRLVFTVEPGPDATGSEKDLVLRQNPILMTTDVDEQHYPLVLARNVKDFIVECWNTNGMQWDDEWVLNTNSIPPMVRVSLLLGSSAESGSAATLAITRLIALPSITMPTGVQMPRGSGGGGQKTPTPAPKKTQ
jgi:prepilin-type N-terminal cleavage/methylation domain-containing protein